MSRSRVRRFTAELTRALPLVIPEGVVAAALGSAPGGGHAHTRPRQRARGRALPLVIPEVWSLPPSAARPGAGTPTLALGSAPEGGRAHTAGRDHTHSTLH